MPSQTLLTPFEFAAIRNDRLLSTYPTSQLERRFIMEGMDMTFETSTGIGADVLTTTETLAAHLEDETVAVVEVDEDTSAFGNGHIPGAVSLDWAQELHAKPRRDFVSGEELAELFASKGISSDQTVVLYGGNNNWFAAYAYWLCKLRGIDNVTLLDGGRKKWELEDRPLTTQEADVSRGTFESATDRPQLRASRDELVEIVGQRIETRRGAGGFAISPRWRNPRLRQRVPRRAIGTLPRPFDAMGTAIRADVGNFRFRH